MNNPYTLEEQELVRRCLRRDDRAQMRLYRKYVQAMYNTVVRMVSNKMDAEDIIQEVASARITERGGRADDKRSEAAMEERKMQGYF